MKLPIEDGAYVVMFDFEDGRLSSTHSIDRFGGHWWNGSEIVDENYILNMIQPRGNGTLYRVTSMEKVEV